MAEFKLLEQHKMFINSVFTTKQFFFSLIYLDNFFAQFLKKMQCYFRPFFLIKCNYLHMLLVYVAKEHLFMNGLMYQVFCSYL